MKQFKLLIEEEWSERPRGQKFHHLQVIDGTVAAPNLIALLREQLAFRYFGGKLPNMARLNYLDFDPKIDKDLRLPSVSGTWCNFSFIPPDHHKNRCVSVEARKVGR